MKDMGRSDPPPFFLASDHSVALVVPAISSAVADSRVSAILREGAQIMIRVMAIFYLSQEPVKEWFANCELHRSLRK